MKLISTFFICLIFFEVNSQQSPGYTIHGHLEGLLEGEKVTMILSNTKGQGSFWNYATRTDSAYVKDGAFFIKGVVPEGPRFYLMTFDKHNGINLPSKIINLFINNSEQITVTSSNIDSIPHESIQHYVHINGSPTNYSMMCMSSCDELYHQSMGLLNNYANKIKDSFTVGSPLDVVFALRNQINQAYYFTVFHGGSERDPELQLADIFLPTNYSNFQMSGHASFWIDYYNSLDPKIKNSFNGKWLKQLITLCVGQPMPEFTLPQANSKLLKLREIVPTSKVTLVHFWASNSQNRKEYQDELRLVYKKYHDKGLNIVGVSSDKYLEEWNETLKRENYSWLNVIDKGGQIVEKVYYEYGAFQQEHTTNVLVNQDGKIIAWDVKGLELQYFVWKAIEENTKSKTSTKPSK